MLEIRKFKMEDIDEIANWTISKEAYYKWSAGMFGNYPFEKEKMKDFYNNANNDLFFPFSFTINNELIGHLIMRYIDYDKKELRFGFVINNINYRGKGYGKEMLKLAIDYAFKNFSFNVLSLVVFEENQVAYNCYKSVGFIENNSDMGYLEIDGLKYKRILLEIRKG